MILANVILLLLPILTIRESIITCMNLLEINFSYGVGIPRYEITLKSYILNSILKQKQKSQFNIQFELNSILLLTHQVQLIYKNPKSYHYSNECCQDSVYKRFLLSRKRELNC